MQEDLEKFKENNTLIVGISYDPVDTLAKFANGSKVSFPLLSDVGAKVIEEYDLLNETPRFKIAHPATILIGKDGVIKAKLFEEGYAKRHSNDALIEETKKLKGTDN